MKMNELQDLTEEQRHLIEEGCSKVWPIERPTLRWSLQRNIRRQSELMSRGVKEDGIQAVALLIMTGPWIVASGFLGVVGALLPALVSGAAPRLVGHVCIAVFVVTFLIGVERLGSSMRSKRQFRSK
jgi:hypothetical protein